MNPRARAERALRHAPIMTTAKPAVLVFVEQEIREAINEIYENAPYCPECGHPRPKHKTWCARNLTPAAPR